MLRRCEQGRALHVAWEGEEWAPLTLSNLSKLGASTVLLQRELGQGLGPSRAKIRVPLFAARTLNATVQCRVTLSLR